MLSDADVLYIRDSPVDDLREELRYAGYDTEYARALAHEILRRVNRLDLQDDAQTGARTAKGFEDSVAEASRIKTSGRT